MRSTLVITAALLAGQLASSSPAAAAPTAAALEARKAALAEKLAGQGYTIVVAAPFVVIGDEGARRVASRVNFLRWVVDHLTADYGARAPDKIIEVWLFRDEKHYRAGAKRYFDDTPDTPYGYYSPDDDALVMNIGPGAGTLSHELVHPYVEANLPAAPTWFNEGLASLYEQPRERGRRLWGTTNWRLPGLVAMIHDRTLPPLATLVGTTSEAFYGAEYDAYAYARFLCQYLQDHGQLRAFYDALAADRADPSGAAALAKVVGEDLATFQPRFERWVRTLRR